MNRANKIEAYIKELTLDEKISLCTGKNSWQTQNIERLSIPSVTMSDGTNGVRFQKGSTSEEKKEFCDVIRSSFDSEDAVSNTYPATCFPTGSAICCSWNKELIGTVGKAIAKECRALGIDLLLGPGINTRRHPLTARNYEYYSEDPCLAGDMAAAIIQGIQGEGIGTSVKHFACHNSDSFRTRVNAKVSERALREIYLAAFERAVKKAHPLTLMSAYNKVNGAETSGDSRLVKDILKKEWNYDGMVVCDWGAIKDVVESTKGGIDLQMPHCSGSSRRLKEAVESGVIEEALIEERVKRVLNLVLELQEMKKEPEGPVNFAAHHQLAEKAAAESAVLLKNEGHILPLQVEKLKKIAVLGRLAVKPVFQGSGCAIVHAAAVDQPLACIRTYCGENVEIVYAPGYEEDGTTTEALLKEAADAAGCADVVVLFAGNMTPDESDDYNRKDIRIESGHERLLEETAKVNANIVIVLASGEVLEMPWIDQVKGALELWYDGEAMGAAAAALLFGKENPSGRLSATIPMKLSDTPAYLGFAGSTFEMEYTEGIYVGYRYYDKKEMEPRFPFGYGLSYTEFAYENLTICEDFKKNNMAGTEESSRQNKRVSSGKLRVETPAALDGIQVAVEITNTGSVEGKETVQLYIAQKNPKCPRPVRELKGFEKISLQPGEKKTVLFSLEERDFAYYDPDAQAFVVDADEFCVEIGASSRDIRLMDTVEVHNTNRSAVALRKDCGFTELFEDQENVKAFDRFLEENGLIESGQADEEMHHFMLNSFWSIGSYLDMNAGEKISWEMVEQFIEKRNQAYRK